MGGSSKSTPGLAVAGLLLTIFGCNRYLPQLKPDGFPSGEQALFEGRLTIPASGLDYALLDTKQLIAENLASADQGRQRVEIICLLPGPAARSFAETAQKAPVTDHGARMLWVKFQAQPRYSTGACMNSHQDGGRRQVWGRYLRVLKILSSKPMQDEWHMLDGSKPF